MVVNRAMVGVGNRGWGWPIGSGETATLVNSNNVRCSILININKLLGSNQHTRCIRHRIVCSGTVHYTVHLRQCPFWLINIMLSSKTFWILGSMYCNSASTTRKIQFAANLSATKLARFAANWPFVVEVWPSQKHGLLISCGRFPSLIRAGIFPLYFVANFPSLICVGDFLSSLRWIFPF